MDFGRFSRGAVLASALWCAMLSPGGPLQAATFLEFVDPNPAPGNQFGATVVPLSTGNVVITSPFDDAGGTDAGAVYLFNGSTGALISTMRGTKNIDNVGSGGVTALSNGNYVVRSPNWDNGPAQNVGAATWGSGTTGVSGVVSFANSLIGSLPGDNVGSGGVTVLSNDNYLVRSPNWGGGPTIQKGAVTWGSGTTGVTGLVSAANSLVGSTVSDQVGSLAVVTLSNGNYVVRSPNWDNGAAFDAGAVTWGSGTTGVSGVVSAANSLVGSTAVDIVGNLGVVALSNGNYVVTSTAWDNGAVANVGAATWGSGTTGVSGVVSAANSLVGSTAGDIVGNLGVVALSNGNYVVASSNWDNGALLDAGAATWASGTTGVTGVVSAANSLVGSTSGDNVGGGVTALTNGNYVVSSSSWDNGAIANVGAATWASGTTGVTGAVSAANSLVGSTGSDQVGNPGVTALSNGNYVVSSANWDNGAVLDAGASTWGSGTTGVTGVISAANSLVGSTANDFIGFGGVTVLSNGNYVIGSPSWNNGAAVDAGAATWVSGATGASGVISAANSLVGSTAGDGVATVTALSNGNYVVLSPSWNNGAAVDAGAVTWGGGTTGVTGVVSAANSLVGSAANSFVGNGGVLVLSNGNYVVLSPNWDIGAATDAGAVTWGSGTTGANGVISAANSLVGSTTNDNVGISGATALSNGNYVVLSPTWDNGAVVDAGAATWGSGTAGVTGAVSAANSLVGSSANNLLGNGGVLALSNGNYVVVSPSWINGAATNAGAATWGSGTTGVRGVISAASSIVGTTASTSLQPVVADNVNRTFYGRFLTEGGGRVRVGLFITILSVVDVRNDQGRQVRLSFTRSSSDVLNSATPIVDYYIYRRDIVALSSATRLSRPPNAATPNQALIAGWDYVMTVPATTDDVYQTVVPTLADSNASGFHRTVLFVRAATATPGIYFDSAPDSGWSADNLPPAPPAPFLAAHTGGATHLHWGPNVEPDLWHYAVYRGSSAGFIPGPSNRIATPSDTGYADVGPAGSYYKLSAVDVNGNESGFALITPDGTTGVGGEPPVAFALEGVRPNPASGRGLHVALALPTGAAARLELLDVSGRRVLARDVGSLGVGRHTVNLAAGRSVAPGLYWVRLTQGANRQTTRVAVIE